MKIQLVGPTYQMRSLPFDAQRTVNMFPVFDELGKEVSALYGTPGLSLFGSGGAGPVRGCFFSSNGRAFFVSNTGFYELSSSGGSTLLGSLNSSEGNITIDENFTQLFVCDGKDVYVLTYATDNFAQVTDPDLPSSGTITSLDSYAIVNKNNSGEFYISNLADATNWEPLDFATAESSPDELLRVFSALGQLWLFGERTTEIYTNTGASTFPFERISGAKFQIGILAPYSAITVSNQIFWIGRDEFGSGVVYSAQGFTPQRISTNAIEFALQKATNTQDIVAWTYQQEGHTFIVFTGGGLETSLVYDLSTQLWHERAFLRANGEYSQHLGRCHMFAFGKNLVGDRLNGNIYELDLDVYTDNGEEIPRERTYTHLSEEDQRIRYSSLELSMEVGIGNAEDDNPQCTLEVSKDQGRLWSNPVQQSMGKIGEYMRKINFRRIGIAETLTFRWKTTAPVKIALTGSYLK